MDAMLGSVNLGPNVIWLDEYRWSPVSQSVNWSLTGALILEDATRQAGRPITLGGMWLRRDVVELLRSTLTPGAVQTLQLPDGRTFSVAWRQRDVPIEARPVFDEADPAADTLYDTRLRLMEIA